MAKPIVPVVHVAKALVRLPGGEALALTRSRDDYHRPGDIDLPGGGVEPKEPLEAGLERELREEVGLETHIGMRLLHAESAHVRGSKQGSWRGKERIVTYCLYEVSAPADFEPRISEEHEKFEWVSPEDLAARLAHTHWGPALRMLLERSVIS